MPQTGREEARKVVEAARSTPKRELKDSATSRAPTTDKPRAPKKKKGRKPKAKPDVFTVERLAPDAARTERETFLDGLVQSRHLDEHHQPFPPEALADPDSAPPPPEPADALIPPLLFASQQALPMDTPSAAAALHHSLSDFALSGPGGYLSPPRGFLRPGELPPSPFSQSQLIQRSSRHLNRPDYYALGTY